MSIKLKSLLKESRVKLREADTEAEIEDLSKAFKAADVATYVSMLQKYQSDPKVLAVLRAGLTDGAPDDEKFGVSGGSIAVKNLKPTQNEIGAQESLKNIAADPFKSLVTFLKGNADIGPDPVIVYNGEYVLDGHHRWSQVYAANPDAKIPVINVTGKISPKDVLKAVHTAIAIDAGGTKTIAANLKAGNLLTYSPDDVAKMMTDNLTDDARKVWGQFGYKDDNAIIKHVQSNVKTMLSKSKPESWAPKRDSMPQPGASGSESWGKQLKAGKVNLINPKLGDVKSESINKNRWQQIANIKKK